MTDKFYKLVLNGTSGLIDMKHSWLYNPHAILKLRLTGQMILLRCIQDCISAGWKVFSTNTDGLTVRVPRAQLEDYKKLIDDIGNEFQVSFEHETFKSIHYIHINAYIAICENGIIKKKGEFLTKPELSTSTDNLVIPKLLQCYFVDGIQPEYILQNLDEFEYKWDGKLEKLSIFDFCASQKVDKSYTIQWYGKPQQRLNRYYVSKKGAYLYKVRDGKASHMLKGWAVQLYNNHIHKPLSEYEININYYLNKIHEVIEKIQTKQQSILFV